MIWGVLRRRVASVLGQAWKAKPTVSGSSCYHTARKESSFIWKEIACVQSSSYHTFLGGHAYPKLGRDVNAISQTESFIRLSNRSFSSDDGDVVEAAVPFMGESITDGTLALFLKKPGDRVEADEPIAQIETDKVTIDVVSPVAGVITKLLANQGDTVEPGIKVAAISKSGEGAPEAAPSEKAVSQPPPSSKEEAPKTETAPIKEAKKEPSPPQPKSKGLPPPPKPTEPQLPPKDRERRVPMTRLRKRVATRLKDSQNTFALLTTFNEVDMTNLMNIRSEYKDAFYEKHGVKLGLMSGFVKAAISALQYQPVVNAVIDGDDIIYRDYIDISIAVGTPKGLVVPVLRNAERMNFAEIEKEINTLAKKATAGSISIDEMAGGTFTISNGGVYGSLLSTPIINPPQSAILGMHSIVSRPMVVGGNVVPRPMMYIALTYDHRLIDGREAVFFLRRIKDVVEDPRRLLLDV
ncbi:dihydrolipoyllysine-residue succinyltransferase component of 2-oxoglutarate dehydrogenase complex 2, mitochondrial-like isoform X2 [Humulus lupulus]|uniref:dihydrolipoyllysine-residue succinyltransferase component of 2-oxoglutarate dehydrogenase complex 2, mitochondrial-like isoform X2 n=1 Tax=Humulus lupulus TaxID=3486 RepID=UPI002B40858F|nr:dihydrolipoyllysine-residue succinyltransferase component of 2-oxoglutarate dehydrogenase complex 2, mitochondrial-like isoform X2 [Humulus lupulus]